MSASLHLCPFELEVIHGAGVQEIVYVLVKSHWKYDVIPSFSLVLLALRDTARQNET